MSTYRTHNCGELRISDVGKKVTISGFLETIRDLGGLVFLDIRDMYGITQVVTSAESKDVDEISHIPVQSVVTVYGTVRKRVRVGLFESRGCKRTWNLITTHLPMKTETRQNTSSSEHAR